LKEDLVTELTESLANFIFPNMIDTTADSVQEVTSKLNGAQANQHTQNSTNVAPDSKLGSPLSIQEGSLSDITPDEDSEPPNVKPVQITTGSANNLPSAIEIPANQLQITTDSVSGLPPQLNFPSTPLKPIKNLPPLNVSTLGTPSENLEYDYLVPAPQQQSNQSVSTENFPHKTSVSIQPEPEDNDEYQNQTTSETTSHKAPIYTSGSGIEISGDNDKGIPADFISGNDDDDDNDDDENSIEVTISGDDQSEGEDASGDIPAPDDADTAEDFVTTSNETAGGKHKDHHQATSSPASDPPKYPYNYTSSYPYIMPQQFQILQPAAGKSPMPTRKFPTAQKLSSPKETQTFYRNPSAVNTFSSYNYALPKDGSQRGVSYSRPPIRGSSGGQRRRRSVDDIQYQRDPDGQGGRGMEELQNIRPPKGRAGRSIEEVEYMRPPTRRKGRSLEDVLRKSDDNNILFTNPFWDIHYDHNTLQVRSQINRPKVYHKTLNNMINKRWLIPGK